MTEPTGTIVLEHAHESLTIYSTFLIISKFLHQKTVHIHEGMLADILVKAMKDIRNIISPSVSLKGSWSMLIKKK